MKDENKHDAAVHAFSKISQTFSDRFNKEVDAAVMASPNKDRQYASQRLLNRQFNNTFSQSTLHKRESQMQVEDMEQTIRLSAV